MSVVMFERDTSRFYRRVLGYLPGQGTCHSQIELSVNGRWLLLHLASTTLFSVAIGHRAVAKLLQHLADPTDCRVAVWQNDVERWLTVRAHGEKGELPMLARSAEPAVELAVAPSREHQIRLVFPGEQLRELRRHLTAAYLQLEQP